MTPKYFATFPAGCYEIISRHLKGFKLDELRIIDHDESSVLFESSLNKEKLIEIRYFTNVYLVADDIKHIPKGFISGQYFSLFMLLDGQPQSMAASKKESLEAKIKSELKLTSNTHLSLNNFCVIKRSGGEELLTLRLPRAKFKRQKLNQGELRPELANIICLAAGIKAKHQVLDMFAGCGALPLEAIRGFGCKDVLAVDVKELSGRHNHPEIKWHLADSKALDFISSDSIDRIITDPPWGEFDKNPEIAVLYKEFLNEIVRTLKPNGVAVVLTSYDRADQMFESTSDLSVIKKWNILVSGKKTEIYKLQKH